MNFLDSLSPIIENSFFIGYLVVFLIFFLESLVFVGLLVPGTIFLALIGFLVSIGIMGWEIFFIVVAAIFLGDFVSFYLGGHGKNFFKEGNRIFKLSYLLRGEEFFEQNKNLSMIIGRFVGFVRPLIPFIAGIFKMNKRKFFLLNTISILIWATFYFVLGYFFGQALDLISLWSKRFSYSVILAAIFLVLVYLVKRYLNFRKNGN